jgi:hypothetical protein
MDNDGDELNEDLADDAEPVGYVPTGFKDADEFLKHVRDEFAADASYDRINREQALEDLKFIAGDQWDATAKANREAKGRPCLTINVLPQFVGQVMGDRRMNKTSIKISPDRDGTCEEAEIRSGLIKGIESNSRAERVYDAALEDQVSCGISNFRIDMEYAGNDVFEQDIFIRHIPNPLAVIWDRMSVDPTGKDARHCFVQDVLPTAIYEKRFPKNPAPSSLGDDMTNTVTATGWFDKDVVRITEFWELIDKPALFALMQDGKVEDVTDKAPEEYMDRVYVDPKNGKPKIRKSFRTYARMHLVTGFAILSEAYELPLTRLPIIKVEGRIIRVGDDRIRYGLVRFAKDSQRLKNYWRSVAAETLALAPKAQWVAREDAVEGREDEWKQAHITGETVLIYNKKGEKPERSDPPTVPAALLQEAQMNQQDIKDTTGLQDASLGMRSNEISGRAIKARQSEGDVATIIYHDNLNQSILEGGDVVNQLLPLAYDSLRTALYIGPDDKRLSMKINDPNDDESPNITAGKYNVTIETGPSFATQRQEAADAMTTLVQTAPQLFAIAGDLLVKNMDWPGAYEISERLKSQMKKEGILPPDETDQPDPQAQAEQQAQMQMQQAQLQEAQAQLEHAAQMRQLEFAQTQAEVETAQAGVATAQANMQAAQAAAEQAQSNALKAKADADKARTQAEQAEVEAKIAPMTTIHKMDLAERTASTRGQNQDRGAGSRPAGDRGNRPAPRGKKK